MEIRMRIFCTGASGKAGKWAVRHVQVQGHTVVNATPVLSGLYMSKLLFYVCNLGLVIDICLRLDQTFSAEPKAARLVGCAPKKSCRGALL